MFIIHVLLIFFNVVNVFEQTLILNRWCSELQSWRLLKCLKSVDLLQKTKLPMFKQREM